MNYLTTWRGFTISYKEAYLSVSIKNGTPKFSDPT